MICSKVVHFYIKSLGCLSVYLYVCLDFGGSLADPMVLTPPPPDWLQLCRRLQARHSEAGAANNAPEPDNPHKIWGWLYCTSLETQVSGKIGSRLCDHEYSIQTQQSDDLKKNAACSHPYQFSPSQKSTSLHFHFPPLSPPPLPNILPKSVKMLPPRPALIWRWLSEHEKWNSFA